MATALSTPVETVADLLARLGGIAPARVRLRPVPGTATVEDVVAIERGESRLFELIDGVLVEKVMGFRESLLAAFLIEVLRAFVRARNLGLVTSSDGMVRIFPDLVRIPDAAFLSWERIPGGRVPTEPVPHLVPDLAIEVQSTGNTADETARKLGDYFRAGVRLVWLVEPTDRTVIVHTSPTCAVVRTEAETLDGGDVLPGLTIPLRSLFGELDSAPNR